MFVYVKEILDQLEATSSSNEKAVILQKYESHVELRETIKHALDPMIVFGIKKIPEYKAGVGMITLERAIVKLGMFSSGSVTGNKAIKHLQVILESVTEQDAIVIERIIKKDLRCGCGIKLVNKAYGRTVIADYPCAKSEKYTTSNNLQLPWIAQRKEDGVRINAFLTKGVVTFRTGNGKPVTTLGHLHNEIANSTLSFDDVVLDGEFIVLDAKGKILSRKAGNGIVNKAIRGTINDDEASRLRYVIWDAIPVEQFEKGVSTVPYSDVLEYLQNRLNTGDVLNNKISLVDTVIINSEEEAIAYYQLQRELGYEGSINKDYRYVWANNRSKFSLKMKAKETIDLRILRVLEGTGENVGKLGSFFVGTDDQDLTVNVGTGFSREQRIAYFNDNMIGKIIEVEYNEPITNRHGEKSLFLPVFKLIRDDKSDTDNAK